MKRTSNNKPTYTIPVAICAITLFAGSILLSILMATRQMAPPRKYNVNTSGEVIGIDTTSKIPVLTKQEAEKVEEKENKKVEYIEPEPTPSKPAEPDIESPAEPVIVPSTPPTAKKEEPVPIKVQRPEMKAPKIEQVEQ